MFILKCNPMFPIHQIQLEAAPVIYSSLLIQSLLLSDSTLQSRKAFVNMLKVKYIRP